MSSSPFSHLHRTRTKVSPGPILRLIGLVLDLDVLKKSNPRPRRNRGVDSAKRRHKEPEGDSRGGLVSKWKLAGAELRVHQSILSDIAGKKRMEEENNETGVRCWYE